MLLGYTAHCSTVELIVVVCPWVHVGTIQVQVISVVIIVRRRRPVVAVAASIIHRPAVNVAGVEVLVFAFNHNTNGIKP